MTTIIKCVAAVAIAATAVTCSLPITHAYAKTPEKTQTDTDKQLKCLTDSVYYEARNQSRQGKIAVANVVMNRVTDKRFPNTPCSVIYQRHGNVCQFSWACKPRRPVRNPADYQQAREIATLVYCRRSGDVTGGALFFHARYVKPRWGYVRTKVIGDHIFYKA